MVRNFILTATLFTLPSLAQAQVLSSIRTIPLNHQGGTCPAALTMGSLGESFGAGIRYTLSIKDIVQPGTVRAQPGPRNHTEYAEYADSVGYVIFTATLKPNWRSCKSDTFVSGLTMNQNGVVRITLQNGKLRYVFKDETNVIRTPSTFNNQAILFYSELL